MTISTTTPPPTAAPVVPTSLTRRLARAVAVTTLITVGAVLGGVKIAGRPDWSTAAVAATLIALLGAAASLAVLSQAAGRSVDWLVTIAMGTTVVRMGVYGVGLLVALYGFKTPAEPTGVLVGLFFVVTLVVETALLYRGVIDLTPPALAPSAVDSPVGGTHV